MKKCLPGQVLDMDTIGRRLLGIVSERLA